LQRGVMLRSVPVEGGLREAMINEAMARAFWPERDAVGARFELNSEPFIAAGVVRDGFKTSQVYLPFSLASAENHVLWIRVRGEAGQAVPLIAAVLRSHAVAGELLLVAPLREVAFRTVSVFARLGAYVGALALGLAAAGVYASMAFSTSQRTREIGVRMALGATPGSVLVLVLRHAARVIGAGAAVGLVLALIGLRLLFGMISRGDTGVDVVAIAAVSLFFAIVAALACLVPARRAAKVEPMVALRTE
jgi:putative ABC transport system permease protein